jgi:hypothetical protein
MYFCFVTLYVLLCCAAQWFRNSKALAFLQNHLKVYAYVSIPIDVGRPHRFSLGLFSANKFLKISDGSTIVISQYVKFIRIH